MIKTIEKKFCDSCGKEVPSYKVFNQNIVLSLTTGLSCRVTACSKTLGDFCGDCIDDIAKEVEKIVQKYSDRLMYHTGPKIWRTNNPEATKVVEKDCGLDFHFDSDVPSRRE